MKAHYRTYNGRLLFEVEGDTQKAVIKAIAELHQIFEGENTCGCCGSPSIHLNVRTVDSNEFYSWVCAGCGASLSLGQHKNGRTLFPKRLGPDNRPLPNRGWLVWVGDKPAAKRPHALEKRPAAV